MCVEAIRHFYLMTERLPAGPDEIDEATAWRLMVRGLYRMRELGLGRSDDEFFALEREVFGAALVEARPFTPQWDTTIAECRRRLESLEGDLAAQIDMLREREFAGAVAMPFLDDLENERGVDGDLLTAWTKARAEWHNAKASPDHPERLAAFSPNVRKHLLERAERDLRAAEEKLAALKDEIVRAAEQTPR